MLRAAFLTVLVSVPLAAQQSAQQIITTAVAKQAAREAEIDNYVIIQQYEMMQAPAYYEKTTLDGRSLFRLVPMPEWQQRAAPAGSDPAFMGSQMARGLDMLNTGMRQEMAGSPAGAMFGAYLNNMLTDMATFSRATAVANDSISDGREEAREQQAGQALFATRARLVGRETIDAADTYHLFADHLEDVPLEQPEDGGKVTMVDAAMWLDATTYVPRRLVMNAVAEQDRKKVPITIELFLQDYQERDGLLVAGRHVMRLSGLMEAMAADSKDRRELEKARREAADLRAKMADMDEQMAQIPAAMRSRVQAQVDRAIAQLEMLSNEGTFEAIVTYRIHSVNAGPPFDWTPVVGSPE